MSEVEKMYMRCKIKKQQNCSHTDTCYNGSLDECEGCNSYQYPPFTAEKQIELIKWLVKTRPIHITFLIDKWVIEGFVRYGKRYDTFEDALSGYINNIWQDLTESEQEQIRSILNG